MALRCRRSSAAVYVGIEIEHHHHEVCGFSKGLFLRSYFYVFIFWLIFLYISFVVLVKDFFKVIFLCFYFLVDLFINIID